jgi:hypothetical protein
MEHQMLKKHAANSEYYGNAEKYSELSDQIAMGTRRFATPPANPAQMMQLQRSIGNRSVGQLEEASGGTSKSDAHLAAFKQRCQKYGKVLDGDFVAKFEKYVACLVSNNKEEGMPLLNEVLAHLSKIKAFQIPADVYDKVAGTEDEDKYAENINLWSKTNKHMPNEKAGASGGVTLESSLAGYLFDGLDFGVDYSTSDLLKAQWTEVSHNFVKNAKGVVKAHLLIGVNHDSVMYRTESKVIMEKLKSKEVTKVEMNYYKANLANGTDIDLVPFKTEEITTPEGFEKVLENTVSTIPIGEIKTKDGATKTIVFKTLPTGRRSADMPSLHRISKVPTVSHWRKAEGRERCSGPFSALSASP